MMLRPAPQADTRSATLVSTLLSMIGCSALCLITVYASDPTGWNDPAWWSNRNAVAQTVIVTNNGVVTTNYAPNNNAVANQGQLKQFTARAVDELNADLTNSGGAGAPLSNLVYGWQQDYLTNNYSTNNPPYKPSDFQAVNVGQVKYIGKLVWSQLTNAGYASSLPVWLSTTNAADMDASNLGQLKDVFDFNPNAPPAAVTGLNATAISSIEVELSWTDPVNDGLTSIVVQRSSDGGTTWTDVATLPSNSTSYKDSNLSAGQTALYQVVSANQISQSTSASQANTQGTAQSPALAAPTGLTGSLDDSLNYNLFWTASTGATSYEVYREELSTGTWHDLGNATGTTYTDSVSSRQEDGYHYEVVALGNSCSSGASNIFPESRFAVIDLGTNNVPIKVTNSGNVLMTQHGTPDPQTGITQNEYSCYINGTNLPPLSPADSGSYFIASDITEDGTVIGSETTNDPSSDEYGATVKTLIQQWNLTGDAMKAQSASQGPAVEFFGGRITSFPVDSYGDFYVNNEYHGNDCYRILAAGNFIDANHDVFSTDCTYAWNNNGFCFWDSYEGNSEIGTINLSQSTGYLTGSSAVVLAVNNEGNYVYSLTAFDTDNFPYFAEMPQPYTNPFFYSDGTHLTFTPTGINNASTPMIVGHQGATGERWDAETGYHLDFIGGAPVTLNAATQIIDGVSTPAYEALGGGLVWDMDPASQSFDPPSALADLLPEKSGYFGAAGSSINDKGAIVGTATYTPQGPNDPIPAGSHGVMLVPIQCNVVNRDDPTQTWANAVLQNGIPPVVYGGITSGDMVGWKLAGTDSWTNATFTWSVTDSSGNPVIDFNGTTITGPSGAGINEWRIATWSAGGNDPNNQWLTWKPGTYTIKCVVGSSTCTFTQTVGNRTKDVLIVGWINPAGLSLPTSGCDADVLSTFPSSGTFASFLAKTRASSYIADLAVGSTLRPAGSGTLNSADDTYILNWMFHFAGNTAPPSSFANEAAVDTFVSTPTNYKLVNRFQAKWQESSGTFQSPPTQIKDGTSVAIGTTTDPIWGLPVPGQAGPANGRIRVTGNVSYHQMNDGSPDFIAVDAFNTLMSPNKWSDIGSRIDFGIPINNQGSPPIMGYTVENQVYPTYNIYVRNSDGSFTQVNTIPQATNPSGNFSSSPYPPTLATWVLP